MELKVNAVTLPEAITFNYEELKDELLQKVSFYESLVYTDDQIRSAKTDRANLNRLKKALNDERLKREREYMKPFDDFKSKINEIIRIIDKPASVIDQQIKAAEERQKVEKKQSIIDYWNEKAHEAWESGRLPEEIGLPNVFDEKWLNASVSMKSIQDAIDAKIQQIAKDLAVLRSLPLYAFEAEECYIDTLDLARAVSEAHRLQEMAEKKAAFEAEQEKRKAEAAAVVQSIPSELIEIPQEPVREWVKFQALMTVDEAKELGQYMRSHGIKYKAV